MNREFEHDYEPEAGRGRSRRRDAGASRGHSSAGRRMGSGNETRETKGRRDTAAAQVKRRRRQIIMLILAECFALCFIFGFRYVKQKASLFQVDEEIDMKEMTNPNITVEKEQAMKGYWTVALFGVDSRNSSLGKGNNADVIIICNINQKNGEIKLASVFRDTYLNIDSKSSYNKINMAYAQGGPKQAVEALNRNLDLQIDDYATFNWKAVADAINILGGVDVELSKAEFYYINAYITETVKATGVPSRQLKSAGPNHLDGVQAVAYARLRKMDTDYARTERQRLIMQLCFDKLKKGNFALINNVMEIVFPQILTSITIDDVIPAAKNLAHYTIADTIGFPAARSDGNMGKKGDCVIPQTLESNVIDLHKFFFEDDSYQPSDMVKQISARISADSGKYKEAKPIESVGTDGGYIPKETTKAETSAEETGETQESSETSESIIDGEFDWILETDEDGMPIDPPEDFDFGTWRPSGSQGTDESSSEVMFPGSESSSGRPLYPGSEPTSPTRPLRPGSSQSASESSAVTPGDNEGETDDANSGPGAGGSTRPSSSAAFPGGSTRPSSSAAFPGESTQPSSSAAFPGGSTGTTAPYPGATTEAPTVPGGPGSVIIGPGV